MKTISTDDIATIVPSFIPVDVPSEYSVMPTLERSIIIGLGKAVGAKNVLELGTWLGGTAMALASVFDRVYTIDAPYELVKNHLPEDQASAILPMGDVGILCRDLPNVTFLVLDTSSQVCWNWAHPDYFGFFDLIFIDANHSLEFVINDTMLSLPLLSKRSVLIWHDVKIYNGKEYGPLKALKLLPLDTYFIEGTTLAFLLRW